MIEVGLIERWRKKYYPQDKCGKYGQEIAAHAATLTDTSGAFLLAFAGITVSVLFLLYELCAKYRKQLKLSEIRKRRRTLSSTILHTSLNTFGKF